MKLTIVGSSDAFGSGGRLQTCFHVAAANTNILIDCGATSLIGLFRLGLDPNDVSTIFISHLHGDHYAGLVWWMLHAQHVAARREPLTVIGPPGIEARFKVASEALFPNSTDMQRSFELAFAEYPQTAPIGPGNVNVTAFEVSHPCGAPPYALRLNIDDRTIAFSGDTEWVENLVPASQSADVFICECFGYMNNVRYHMNWATISKNLDRLSAKQIVLTHMGPEMLANCKNISDPRVKPATDGMVLEI